MPSSSTHLGVVLHIRTQKDHDARVEVLTAQHGKISLLAKGLKRPTSRRQGAVRPGNIVKISWHESHDQKILTEATLYQAGLPNSANLTQYRDLFTILEYVRGLSLSGQSDPTLFATTLELITLVGDNTPLSRGQIRAMLHQLLNREGTSDPAHRESSTVSQLFENITGYQPRSFAYLQV